MTAWTMDAAETKALSFPSWLEGLTGAEGEEGSRLLDEIALEIEEQVAERAPAEREALREELRRELRDTAAGKSAAERLALLRMTGLDRRIRDLRRRTFALARSVIDGERERAAAVPEAQALLDECSALGRELDALINVARHLGPELFDATLEARFLVEDEAITSDRLAAYLRARG